MSSIQGFSEVVFVLSSNFPEKITIKKKTELNPLYPENKENLPVDLPLCQQERCFGHLHVFLLLLCNLDSSLELFRVDRFFRKAEDKETK